MDWLLSVLLSKVTSDYEVILFSSWSLSDLSLPDIGEDFTWKKNRLTKQGQSSPWLGVESGPQTFSLKKLHQFAAGTGSIHGLEMRWDVEVRNHKKNTFTSPIWLKWKKLISIRLYNWISCQAAMWSCVSVCESAPACVLQEALLSHRITTRP